MEMIKRQRNQQLLEALQLDEFADERRARLRAELPAQVTSGAAWDSLPNWKVAPRVRNGVPVIKRSDSALNFPNSVCTACL